MDIVKDILSLPSKIVVEGVSFRLDIFVNGDNDLRICYVIQYVDPTSPHFNEIEKFGGWYNPVFEGEGFSDFLMLSEYIYSDVRLIDNIRDFKTKIEQVNKYNEKGW